jgi:hypothetical protein
MTDNSSTYPPSSTLLKDFSTHPVTENVIHNKLSSDGFTNPLALNNTNNLGAKATEYEPQSQWRETERVNNTSNMYPALRMMNPQLDQIENFKIWSVINTLCCCLCLGLVACHYSFETENYKVRGDFQSALRASKNARMFNIIATVIGLILTTYYIFCIAKLY